MKIYSENLKVLESDLDYLVNNFGICDKSMANAYFTSIIMLNDMYKVVTGKDYVELKKLGKQKDRFNRGYIRQNGNLKTYLDNFNKNKDFYREFSLDILDEIEEVNVEPESTLTSIFNAQDTSNIVLDFFKSRNDGSMEVFLDLVKEERIHRKKFSNEEDSSIMAVTGFNIPLGKASIIVNENFNTLHSMASVAHEEGHIVVFMTQLKDFLRKGQLHIYMKQFILKFYL